MGLIKQYRKLSLPGALAEGELHFIYAGGVYIQYVINNAGVAVPPAVMAHGHNISDISGLAGALSGKANSSHTHDASEIVSGIIDSARLPLFTATWASITGKPTTRDGYGLTDVYTIADVNSLLSNKSNINHTHDASQIVSGIIDSARLPAFTASWSSISGKPTTISGYGITDSYTKTEINGFLSGKSNTGHTHDASEIISGIIDSARLPSFTASWSSITGKPNTIAGYGITNAYTVADTNSLLAGKSNTGHTHDASEVVSGVFDLARIPAGSVSWAGITGKPTTRDGFGITDVYTFADVNSLLAGKANSSHTHDASQIVSGIIDSARLPAFTASWSSITGKPTTRDGYGITDVYNTADVNSLLGGKAAASHTHDASQIVSGIIDSARLPAFSASWSSISGKPTTRDGYGITDVYTTGDVNSLLGGKANSSHNHDASQITSGTISSDRLPTFTASWSSISGKPTTRDGYGLTDVYTTADVNSLLGGKANSSHNHDSSQIVSGTLGLDRIPGMNITINGYTQNVKDNPSWSITGGVTGSGISTRMAYWDGGSNLGYSDMNYQSGNYGMGSWSSNAKLTVGGRVQIADFGTSVSNYAILQLDSTSQGFFLPRMSYTQRRAISGGAPPDWLLVVQTDTSGSAQAGVYLSTGGNWVRMTNGTTPL